MRRAAVFTAVFALACVWPTAALAVGDADVAALQVALKNRGIYHGSVDGTLGPGTQAAVRHFQRRKGLAVDGVVGTRTRLALGGYGRRAPLGHRALASGAAGWDVASLQFLLAWHGFPSGNLDGLFGGHTERALRHFERWAGLEPDGRADESTFSALRAPVPQAPIGLAAPSAVPLGDGFGPRGRRFHSGVDYPAPSGAPVVAAASGRVTHAGRAAGGWGTLVVIDHGQGVRTWYAHLSRVRVRVGQQVSVGALVGLVGASGRASGPHLHFEVRLRGAALDPLRALG
jgi:murein DD-endopeptidase MepM/ murein hydrolase activator NlpD